MGTTARITGTVCYGTQAEYDAAVRWLRAQEYINDQGFFINDSGESCPDGGLLPAKRALSIPEDEYRNFAYQLSHLFSPSATGEIRWATDDGGFEAARVTPEGETAVNLWGGAAPAMTGDDDDNALLDEWDDLVGSFLGECPSAPPLWDPAVSEERPALEALWRALLQATPTVDVAAWTPVTKVIEGEHDGETPLHWAASMYRPAPILRALTQAAVERGESLDCANENGETPLYVAARWGSPAAVQILLDAGASPQVGCRLFPGSDTPLHGAAIAGEPATVQLLLSRGADPTVSARRAPDEEGPTERTAAQLAAFHGHTAVAAMLQEAEAHWQQPVEPVRGHRPSVRRGR